MPRHPVNELGPDIRINLTLTPGLVAQSLRQKVLASANIRSTAGHSFALLGHTYPDACDNFSLSLSAFSIYAHARTRRAIMTCGDGSMQCSPCSTGATLWGPRFYTLPKIIHKILPKIPAKE